MSVNDWDTEQTAHAKGTMMGFIAWRHSPAAGPNIPYSQHPTRCGAGRCFLFLGGCGPRCRVHEGSHSGSRGMQVGTIVGGHAGVSLGRH